MRDEDYGVYLFDVKTAPWPRYGVNGAAVHLKGRGDFANMFVFEVAPGKRAWPFHYHFANEEAVYILEGSGTLRLGGEQIEVRAGHFMTFRTGADHAHQLINTGSTPLRYICFSTMHSPEVAGYPDSGKLGIIAGRAPGGSGRVSAMRKCFKESSEVDYFEGES